jgi:hypothetical protein
MALIRNVVVIVASDSAAACPTRFSVQDLGTKLRQKDKVWVRRSFFARKLLPV